MGFINPPVFVGKSSAPGALTCDSVEMTGEWLTRDAQLSGVVDSKSGILSLWVRVLGVNGADHALLDDSGVNGFFVRHQGADDKFRIGAGSPSTTLDLRTNTAYGASSTWRHLLASWDVSTAGARSFYVNDVDDTNQVTFTNSTLDYTNNNFSVGGSTSGALLTNIYIAEVYLAYGQYLDFSAQSNRRKFITALGKPANLGATGSAPTGTAPTVYLHIDDAEAAANFAINRGTGGNFPTIHGTLVTGATSPSD